MKELQLEKIIEQLEKLNIHEWKSNMYLNEDKDYYQLNDYPVLSINFHGLTFHIKKFYTNRLYLRPHYSLEVSNPEKDTKLVYDQKRERKIIKTLYEKIFGNLKEFKQKEFKEKFEEFKDLVTSN